jgi:predicted DsbA family dithiol-disulfide isomerase
MDNFLVRVFIVFLAIANLVIYPVKAFSEISPDDFRKAFVGFVADKEGRKVLGDALQKFIIESQQEEMDRQNREREEILSKGIGEMIGNSPTLGNKNAPVTIIEFSDFYCGHCSTGRLRIYELKKIYGDKLHIVFKNLPLQRGPGAAKAALAAGKQGKFWEFHDALFENQRSLGDEFFLTKAKELGLDIEKFKADMQLEEIQKTIEADMELANKIKINGTPAFLVNNVLISGAQPIENFKEAIDKILKEKS